MVRIRRVSPNDSAVELELLGLDPTGDVEARDARDPLHRRHDEAPHLPRLDRLLHHDARRRPRHDQAREGREAGRDRVGPREENAGERPAGETKRSDHDGPAHTPGRFRFGETRNGRRRTGTGTGTGNGEGLITSTFQGRVGGLHPARDSSARATRIGSAPRAAGASANASLRSLHARARLIRRPARGAVRGPARARAFASRGATLPRAVPASRSLAALRAAGSTGATRTSGRRSAPVRALQAPRRV